MSEPVRLAKLAREHLASALNTLQSDGSIPDELMDTADPIAEAMSVLHRIERSGGAVLEGRTEALKKIRASLNLLLGLTDSHPAIEKVMESVALALVKVASLVRYSPGESVREPAARVPSAPPPAPAVPMPVRESPAPVVAGPTPIAVAPLPVVAELAPVVTPSPPVVAVPVPVPAPVSAPVSVPVPAPVPVSVPVSAPAPVFAPVSAPVSAPAPALAPDTSAVSAVSPTPIAPPTREELARAFARPSPAELAQPRVIVNLPPAQREPSPRPVPGAPKIDVELGTNSPSNFYKGLGGSDVIDHGGIFVATYKIPKLGSTVSLRVLLPGNYEFFANAEVRWTRETGASIDSADPGFGARFTQISSEGRQLVYRYARNREPFFYDDL